MSRLLSLNFVPVRNDSRSFGWLLLTLGLAFLVWVLMDYESLNVQREVNLLELDNRQPQKLPIQLDPKIRLRIENVSSFLSTPWSLMLNEVESAIENADKAVAILEVSPDLDKRQIRILGEAKNLTAAIDFFSHLQTLPALDQPIMVQHEVQTQQRERPVRFEITSGWKVKS